MKRLKKFTNILIFSIISLNVSIAGINTQADSAEVEKVINKFFDWYLTSIKNSNYSSFQPIFIASSNGMTTLDYSEYIKNLTNYNFSDTLISMEKISYVTCSENLANVNFDNFRKTTFIDLDEYEESKCDFSNYYRWIGGQEPVDGIRVKNIKFLSKKSAIASIEYYSENIQANEKFYFGNNEVILIKENNQWLIRMVDSWKRIIQP